MLTHLQSTATTGELPTPQKRLAILVLGMHRSGTSALGGVINAMGAAAPKTQSPPDSWNPRGFFECWPLVNAHDELLAAAGSSWHDWRQLNPEWMHSREADPYRQKIRALLIDEFGDEALIFIKDPRICRFVPFTTSILAQMNIGTVAFVPVRNPLEVAHSLNRRDGMPLPKALLLWLRHVLDAEFHTRHMPRCVLPHEGFLSNWRYHMDRAAEKTGVIWPVASNQPDAAVEQFLTKDLHRERSTLQDMQRHPNITSLVRATYDVLTAIATQGENADSLAQLDLLRTRFDDGCDVFGAAVATEELTVAQLRGELIARDAEAEALRQECLKLATLSELHALDGRGVAVERDGLVVAHTDLTVEYDRLARSHADLVVERDALIRGQADLTAERDSLARSHAYLIAERDGFARVHNNLIAEHDSLARVHADVIVERDALLGSRSWRLTAPMRRLRRLFDR